MNLPSLSKSTAWLCGSWKQNRNEGIICHVEVGIVYVTWIASVMVGHDIQASPPHFQDPKSLTLLSYLACANWQLDDWCTLPADYLHELHDDETPPSPSGARKFAAKLRNEMDMNYPEMYVITKTKSKVDVLWQNGEKSLGLDPQRSLSRASSISDHDFWPDQFVLEKETPFEKFGVVKSVDVHERTVKVKWFVPNLEQNIEIDSEFIEEMMSAYELIVHPDFSYSVGDVVFRCIPLAANLEESKNEQNIDLKQNHYPLDAIHFPSQGNSILGEQMGETGNNDLQSYLSYIGNVLGYKDEGIEIRWASGLVSKVPPSEIMDLDKFIYTTSTPTNIEPLPNIGKDLTDLVKQLHDKKEKKGVDGTSEDCMKNVLKSTSLLFLQTTINFLGHIASSLFSLHNSLPFWHSIKAKKISQYYNLKMEDPLPDLVVSNPASMQQHSEEGKQNEEASTSLLINDKSRNFKQFGIISDYSDHHFVNCTRQAKKISQYYNPKMEDPLPDLAISNLASMQQHAEESKQNEEATTFLLINDKSRNFKQFDIISDYSDHHFVNGTGHEAGQVRRGWVKKIQQEWNFLKNDLPDTIYVRIYEERMDLLRASIVGASGTPYHDGLFFFDIFLPPDYPHEPPVVHYNSGGLRLNPNLYESGEVCLSLLKTWTGTGTEVWNPEKSTILQLLLSLQALVLNEKPYFNEAGYDEQVGSVQGEKNSVTYNENTFLQSCMSMLYVLHRPPKHFEALVEEHFAHRSHHILRACKAYLDGAQVGQSYEFANPANKNCGSSSTGFKIMLVKLLPKLVSAFAEMGMDCSQFKDQATT